jgi:drug/metabolite transporter (DMT)-like permease
VTGRGTGRATGHLTQRDLLELFALAAIWGGSFLFTRIGAPEFGAVALAGLRVIGAALVMLPLLAARRELGPFAKHWKAIFLIGFTNSALPFMCFSYAALTITAGLSSIFNAASPLFGAVIAWLWLRDRLTPLRVLGLIIGFVGVLGLAYSRSTLKDGADGSSAVLAVLACVIGTISYGFSANFTKRYLTGVPPMSVAGGSQIGAALVMLAPTVATWPSATPGLAAWIHLALLAVVCTGLAYIMYFRLIANVGPANAITVTFLVPAFAVAWGAIFLGEMPTLQTILGCAVILLGTSLATGFIPRPRRLSVET